VIRQGKKEGPGKIDRQFHVETPEFQGLPVVFYNLIRVFEMT
jgi:hypothetical protein